MKPAYIGIDLAIAKNKRLPIVVVTWQGRRLVPADLRSIAHKPPYGIGNARTVDKDAVRQYCEDAVTYIESVCKYLDVHPKRFAIDAPSAPRPEDILRRVAELAMDEARINCFTTPSKTDFEGIFSKVRDHLSNGGEENCLPHANQLWMVVGFELFKLLSKIAPCIEVFPQAIARVIGTGETHKSESGAALEQLGIAAQYTGWPSNQPEDTRFENIAFAPTHDKVDAYLSAWVAALEPEERIAFGNPPNDVIWAPRIGEGKFEVVTESSTMPKPQSKRSSLADVSHKRMCPACGKHEFKRWPWGWDPHAAHTCSGLHATDPEERKREFKERFKQAFD